MTKMTRLLNTGIQKSCRRLELLWYLYGVECADRSLYTGITTDLDRRLNEHNNSPKAAKYTRSRRPVKLVYAETHIDRSSACKAEFAFKKLSRKKKLEIIKEAASL